MRPRNRHCQTRGFQIERKSSTPNWILNSNSDSSGIESFDQWNASRGALAILNVGVLEEFDQVHLLDSAITHEKRNKTIRNQCHTSLQKSFAANLDEKSKQAKFIISRKMKMWKFKQFRRSPEINELPMLKIDSTFNKPVWDKFNSRELTGLQAGPQLTGCVRWRISTMRTRRRKYRADCREWFAYRHSTKTCLTHVHQVERGIWKKDWRKSTIIACIWPQKLQKPNKCSKQNGNEGSWWTIDSNDGWKQGNKWSKRKRTSQSSQGGGRFCIESETINDQVIVKKQTGQIRNL